MNNYISNLFLVWLDFYTACEYGHLELRGIQMLQAFARDDQFTAVIWRIIVVGDEDDGFLGRQVTNPTSNGFCTTRYQLKMSGVL